MNLLILTSVEYISGCKIHRIHHLMPYLKKEFKEITYVVYAGKSHINEKKSNVKYLFINSNYPFPIFLKFFSYLKDQLKISLALLSAKKFDFVLIEGPYNAPIFFILKLFRKSKRFVYEDLDYFSAFKGSSFKKNITKLYEFLCMTLSDRIICVGKLLKELRTRQGFRNISVIHNGADYKDLNLNKKNQIIYLGRLNWYSGVSEMMKAFKIVSKKIPNLRLIIKTIADPDLEKRINKMIIRLGILHKVDVDNDLMNTKDMNKILSASLIGLMLFDKDDIMKYAFPLKMVEYSAAGLPVVSIDWGESGKFVRENHNGLLIENSSNHKEIAEKIIQLVKDKEMRANFSRNSTKATRDMRWNKIANKLIRVLKNHPD